MNDSDTLASMKRYAPELELPPYSFVPGKNAHPFRDPDGHSYGAEHEPELLRSLDSGDYENHKGYLYGIDLFNAGYFWECHELLEGIWKNTENENTRTLLQGIIQCAAMLLNSSLGDSRKNAVKNLDSSVSEKFSSLSGDTLGVNPKTLLSDVRTFVSSMESNPTMAVDRNKDSKVNEVKGPFIKLSGL